jgi:NAD-dependent deacetylase
MKKIAIFSGAGLDKESGITTFRDTNDGTWSNYNIDEVCTPTGWKKNREKVLDFYNERRSQLKDVEPNDAHKQLVQLEEKFNVIHITQNVSDLLERAGATNVIHLHGELTKARGAFFNGTTTNYDTVYDIGYNEIKVGDKCEKTNSQLRPHIVWFEEYPFYVDEAYTEISTADILLIIGTSLSISYTLTLLSNVKEGCKVYYIDPSPVKTLSKYNITYIEKPATEGVKEFIEEISK